MSLILLANQTDFLIYVYGLIDTSASWNISIFYFWLNNFLKSISLPNNYEYSYTIVSVEKSLK